MQKSNFKHFPVNCLKKCRVDWAVYSATHSQGFIIFGGDR